MITNGQAEILKVLTDEGVQSIFRFGAKKASNLYMLQESGMITYATPPPTHVGITDTGRIALEEWAGQQPAPQQVDGFMFGNDAPVAAPDDADSPDVLIEAEVLELQDEVDALRALVAGFQDVIAPIVEVTQYDSEFKKAHRNSNLYIRDMVNDWNTGGFMRLDTKEDELLVKHLRAIAEFAQKIDALKGE